MNTFGLYNTTELQAPKAINPHFPQERACVVLLHPIHAYSN